MTSSRYLIAKYVPHLRRMEPRNVGIIFWSPYGVEARFIAEGKHAPGEIDGRRTRRYVSSINTYKQWVQFWRAEIEKEEIKPTTGGHAVSKQSEEFLDALSKSNSRNYFLTDGGIFLDPVGPDELSDAANYLFSELVSEPDSEESSEPNVKDVCASLIKKTHLSSNPDFYPDYEVEVKYGRDGRQTRYEFDYAIVNGRPQRLYQRVHLLKNRPKDFLKNVHNSAWMFEKVIDAKLIPTDSGAAFVYINDELLTEPEIRNPLDELRTVTRVLNLRNQNDLQTAEEEFSRLAHTIF